MSAAAIQCGTGTAATSCAAESATTTNIAQIVTKPSRGGLPEIFMLASSTLSPFAPRKYATFAERKATNQRKTGARGISRSGMKLISTHDETLLRDLRR